ncbi:MAG: site-specific integrase [Alphaproteobacteria bacterium]|nr:MAG: site-specific integrase [Alphaproteobacteria bacterium]
MNWLMSRVKLTDKFIASCNLPKDGREEHSDILCPGLYLRVTAKGVKTFSVVVRCGHLQRHTLGRYPRLALADARHRALQILRENEERRLNPAAMNDHPILFGAMVEQYADLHLKRNNRTWKDQLGSLSQPALAAFAARPAASIERREIIAILDAMVADGKPHAGVNVLKNLKAMYNWAIDRDLVKSNPCERVRQPVPTTERDRVLTDDELARVWRGAGELPLPWASMIRMLILTGQRRTEVAEMGWDEIEGDTWVIPRERVKKDRSHAVPLADQALQVLSPLRQFGCRGFVFSGDGGVHAASNFNKVKKKLDELSGVSGWVLHDIRRTVRSGLAALGVSQEVARAIVNHTDGKIDRVYNRHSYAAEKREALEKWSKRLESL